MGGLVELGEEDSLAGTHDAPALGNLQPYAAKITSRETPAALLSLLRTYPPPPVMSAPPFLLRQFVRIAAPGLRNLSQTTSRRPQWRCPQCAHRPQPRKTQQRRFQSTQQTPGPQPGDDPSFSSIVDQPAQLVKTGRKHGPGLIILGTTRHRVPQPIQCPFRAGITPSATFNGNL